MTGLIAYVVEPNDTLASIAARFGTTVDELARLNALGDPDLIVAGDILLVPAPEE
jgi:LysM repeat protein